MISDDDDDDDEMIPITRTCKICNKLHLAVKNEYAIYSSWYTCHSDKQHITNRSQNQDEIKYHTEIYVTVVTVSLLLVNSNKVKL